APNVRNVRFGDCGETRPPEVLRSGRCGWDEEGGWRNRDEQQTIHVLLLSVHVLCSPETPERGESAAAHVHCTVRQATTGCAACPPAFQWRSSCWHKA